MSTIIKQYSAPASFPDTIVIEIEPTVAYPAGALLGAYRYKRSVRHSQVAKAGIWPAFTVGAGAIAPAFDRTSVTCVDSILALVGTTFPTSGNITLGAVIRQSYPAQSPEGVQAFIGARSSEASQLVLSRNPSGALVMRAGDKGANIPGVDGDRWEAIFGTYDRTTGEVAIYRPRTQTRATVNQPTLVAPAASVRLSGPIAGAYSGYTQEAWNCAYNRLLSIEEIDALYASLKVSLAVSGVEI